jgi:signal transduction histidine kinase/CHASE1-domain containing sensor protein
MTVKAFRAARSLATLVLVLLLLFTCLATAWTYRLWRAYEARRFAVAATRADQATTQQMRAYIATLAGIRGIYATGNRVTLRAFRDLIASMDLPRRYPGIQGIGVCPWVPAAQVRAFEAEAARLGRPGIHLWPVLPGQPAVPVMFLEPLDWRNRRAIGYNMNSEPVRRAAIRRAAETGQPAMTGKVTLVQETHQAPQPGFLIYTPVYRHDQPTRTPAERLANLLGFVYSPLRANDLFRGLLSGLNDPWLQLEIFDGRTTAPDHLLYVHQALKPGSEPTRYTTTFTTTIAGHVWTCRCTAAPAFLGPWWQWPPVLVAVTGGLFSLLLFGLTWVQMRGREDAERLTADLQQAEGEREAALLGEQLARQSAERAERTERFLATASRLLGASLDLRQSLPAVAALAVPEIADACLILTDAAGQPRLAALAHQDPLWNQGLQQAWKADERVVGQGTAEIGPLHAGTRRTAHGTNAEVLGQLLGIPDHLPVWQDLGATAGISAPMQARGQIIGSLVLLRTGPGKALTPEDQVLVEDLAQRVALAIDNANLYREAQAAVAARDEFVSIASHEFKTPLSALKLAIFAMQNCQKAPQSATISMQTLIGMTERQVDLLSKLVNELLDISRLSAGRLNLEPEELDLAAVVQSVVARLDGELQRSGSPLHLRLEPVTGIWDRFRLEQVVTNLLTNAIKYGLGRPIELIVRRQDDTAVLQVCDQGIGIAPTKIERIFAKFERAVSSRHFGGLGLGLFIVRQILDAMGGTIQVTSRPQEGSTFTVTLPVHMPLAQAA